MFNSRSCEETFTKFQYYIDECKEIRNAPPEEEEPEPENDEKKLRQLLGLAA